MIFRFTGGIPRVWHTNLSIQFKLVLLLVFIGLIMNGIYLSHILSMPGVEAAVNTRVDLMGILMGAVVIILAHVKIL